MGKSRRKLRTRGWSPQCRLCRLSDWSSAAAAATAAGPVAGKKDGKVTITMGLFGVMGFKETGLLDTYMKEHPNVVIKADVAGDEQTYYTALQTHLAAGSGLKDIQGIEIGRAKELSDTQQDKFVEPGRRARHRPLPAVEAEPGHHRGRQGHRPGHRHRPDGRLLPQGPASSRPACPPTARRSPSCGRATGRSTSTSGKRFKQNSKDDKVAFMDSSSGLFNAMIYGNSQQFYDKEGELIYATNPVVKDAWKLASEAADLRSDRQAPPVPARLGPGPGQRHLRHRRLPGVDARAHQREGGPGEQGQVGRRQGAQGRQLGRSVPRRDGEEPRQEGGAGARRLAHRP